MSQAVNRLSLRLIQTMSCRFDASKRKHPAKCRDWRVKMIKFLKVKNCTTCKFFLLVNMEGKIDSKYGFGYCDKRIIQKPDEHKLCDKWISK